jgi:hypothetical protein
MSTNYIAFVQQIHMTITTVPPAESAQTKEKTVMVKSLLLRLSPGVSKPAS